MHLRRVAKKLIGELLIDFGVITKDQLLQALQRQKESGKLIGDVLVEMGFATEEDIAGAVATRYGVPYVPLAHYEFDKELTKIVPTELALKYRCMPVDRIGSILTVAMQNPLDENAIEELERQSNHKVLSFVSTPSEIFASIEERYGVERAGAAAQKAERSEEKGGVRIYNLESNDSPRE